MDDTVKRALDKVSSYQDAPHPKMEGWDWQPLRKVQEQLEGLPEIPSHVENFGSYMDETARRAAGKGLTPRDLIKAYVITRSSIQRRAQQRIVVLRRGRADHYHAGQVGKPGLQ